MPRGARQAPLSRCSNEPRKAIDVFDAPNVEPNFNFNRVSKLFFHQNSTYNALQCFFAICRSIGKNSNKKDNSH
jgi:hypothetical protein